MTELEEARSMFEKDAYAMMTGIEIDVVGDRYAKCSLKLNERHCNAIGQVMGGVMYTLADFTFAVAANFKQNRTVTTVSQINYLSPVKGDTLYGESKLIRDGKRNCFYQIRITDNLGTEIAIVSVNGTHL
ncbi:MAG: PaaI family thioesterase [Lachnospiraceae bacterium]|nr:PaaI family thioesterase [Lachnospiraceae bacterium]